MFSVHPKVKKISFYQENMYKSTEKTIQLLFRILMSFIIIILVFSLHCSKKKHIKILLFRRYGKTKQF